MNIRFIILSCVALFATEGALSQSISLSDCIALGLENNYSVRLERKRMEVATNNATIGNAGYLPRLDASGSYSGSLNDTKQYPPEGDVVERDGVNNDQLSAGLNLSWTLFDGLAIQGSWAKLRELEKRGELQLRVALESCVVDVASEYYTQIRQQIRLKNLQGALSLSQERLRIVEERYRIGAASRLELQQASVDCNSDRSLVMKQQEVLYASCVRLNQLLGISSMSSFVAVQDSTLELSPMFDVEGFEDRMISNNAMLLTTERDQLIAKQELRIARSSNLPYLRVSGGYGYSTTYMDQSVLDRSSQLGFNWGATVGINVFDGMNRRREQRNAKAQRIIAELQHQELELSLRSEFANVWMAYGNNVRLAEFEQENLQVARSYYEIALDRYKLGDLSGIELREAQNSLLDAEERLSTALYSTKLCELSLLQLSGDLLSVEW